MIAIISRTINSVMNYMYNGNGDADCDAIGDGLVDYSRGLNRDLNENNLDEGLGVCTDQIVPIDWNSNGTIESLISQDLNFVDHDQSLSCGGVLTVLHDHDDWANIYLPGIARPEFLSDVSQHEVIMCSLPIGGAK